MLLVFSGCKTEESAVAPPQSQSTTTDAQLYLLGKDAIGFVFYKNSVDTIAKGGNSAHTENLRTRYNKIAAQYLDANGKVKTGTIFPDSSLIVKELYTNKTLAVYAFLFKKKGDTNADANGWVWAELIPSGSPLYSVTNKGAGCNGCHSVGIDYTRMNDAHP